MSTLATVPKEAEQDSTAATRESVGDRLKLFINPFDARFEEIRGANWLQVAIRDTSAGLLVAMMAIPMAMGFAIASGLRPEHGILAGAIAGLAGALFSGSKYNVYGPVAALIPTIAAIMDSYKTPDDSFAGHGFLVLICMCSGPLLMLVGLLRQCVRRNHIGLRLTWWRAREFDQFEEHRGNRDCAFHA